MALTSTETPWWVPLLTGLAAWGSTTATRWLRHRHRMTKKSTSRALATDLTSTSAFDGPSTTWEWRRVKIARPPEATGHSAPNGRSFRKLPRRNRREPLTLTIKLRGGPEAWVEVHSRGGVLRAPGWLSVSDLVDILNSHF